MAVNRVWQDYFGLGLVETENDFGTQGTLPTHPELLDWLASEFMDRKWSLKAMHRLIVTIGDLSAIVARRGPTCQAVDARNRLLARQNRLRLEAEVVRDVALGASGLLSPTIGGPSVIRRNRRASTASPRCRASGKPALGEDRYRRGMYTFFWRSAPAPRV